MIRSDLPIGTLAAQLTHAAGESSPGNLPPHTIAVVLGVSSEEELLNEELQLKNKGIKYKSIRETDRPWNGQLMAIGVYPGKREKLKQYFKHLKLLGR